MNPINSPFQFILALLFFAGIFSFSGQGLCEDFSEGSNQIMRLYQQGKPEESLTLAYQELDQAEKFYDPEDPRILERLKTLQALLALENRYPEAKPINDRLLLLGEKIFGEESLEFSEILGRTAGLAMAAKDYQTSEKLYKKTFRIRKKVLGPDDPRTAGVLNNLGKLWQVRGNTVKARDYYLRALAVFEIKAPLSQELLVVQTNLDSLVSKRVDFDSLPASTQELLKRGLLDSAIEEAENEFKKSVSMGMPDETLRMQLEIVEFICLKKQDFKKAASAREKIAAIDERKEGKHSSQAIDSLLLLGRYYEQIPDHSNSLKVYTEVLDRLEKSAGKKSYEYAKTLSLIAGVNDALKKDFLAITQYSESWKILESAPKEYQPVKLLILKNFEEIAKRTKSQEDLAKARQMRKKL